MKNKREFKEEGITLVALIITIIILLILAGIALSQLQENGIFDKAKTSANEYAEKSAKEKLEIKLSSLIIDKQTDSEYNENEYLTNKLKDEGFKVNGNVVTVDGYQFQIDREVPKIVSALGKEDNIVALSGASDFKAFIERVNAGESFEGKIVILSADIDLSSFCSESLGSFTPIGSLDTPFEGIFDGKNHTIKNLYINSEGKDNEALFGFVKNGEVRNLTVEGVVTGSGNNISGIIAQMQDGYIENCTNKANVENKSADGYRTGGVVALIKDTSIKNCENYGVITSDGSRAGGIVAEVSEGTTKEVHVIENCKNYKNVTSTLQAAGIAGWVDGKYIVRNCYNGPDAKILATTKWQAGGILGCSYRNSEVTVDSCVNEGNIESVITSAGGIVGATEGSLTLKNCTNTEMVYTKEGNDAGGILGLGNKASNISISGCKNSGLIKVGVWAGGGIAGSLMYTSTIQNCQNSGEIYGGNGNCGGIVGSCGVKDTTDATLTINNSFNTGYVHAEGKAGNPSLGGIAGTVQFGDKAIINNCYNAGKIASTSYTSDNIYHGVGGIVGTIYNNGGTTKSKVTITNSYNRGNISNSYSSNNAGQIIGIDYNSNRSVTNCYYLSTATGKNTYGGTSATSDNLKKYANKLGSAYTSDKEKPVNDGYPILSWQ